VSDIEVRDAPERGRFEIYVDGTLAGFTEYHPEGADIDFTHTEIDPAFGGQGLGTTLVHGALDDMGARGVGILPHCPFVHSVVEKEPEYLALVPANQRSRFDLPTAEDQ
jgi:predicted GNAT family acetyltransferase